MQDRYLFRGKRIDNGEWVIGNCIDDGVTGQVFIHTVGNSVNESDKVGEEGCLQFVAFEVAPATICQCTGLKDKNGNLIWENDIVKKEFYTDYDAYANSEKYIGVMRYEDGGWWVKTQMDVGQILVRSIIDVLAFSKDVEHFEVLGNVFDNPELLEV